MKLMNCFRKRGGKELKDVFWSIRPLLVICRILGIAPFPLNRDPIYESSHLSNVYYSAFVLSISIVLTVIALACDLGLSIKVQSESTISQSVGALWISVNDLIGAVGFASCLRKRRRCHEMYRSIALYDEKLISLKHEGSRRSVIRQLYFVAMIFCAFGYSVACRSRIFGVFERLIAYYWLTITMLLDLNFYNTLCLLQKRISCLNEDIKASIERCVVDPSPQTSSDHFIEVWKSQWMHLYHLCRSASELFGVQVVLLTLLNVLNVTFISYFAFFYFGGNFINTPRLLFFTISWVAVFLVGLIFLVAACESLTKEAYQTGVLISAALLRVRDYKKRRELRLFSHQLLHMKIHFSACGFFSLDFTLLTSMSAAVVTHLVILVQFQLAGREDDVICLCNR